MKFTRATPIDVVASIDRTLAAAPALLRTTAGQVWWGNALAHASAALDPARRATTTGESLEAPDAPAAPNPGSPAPWWRRLAWMPRSLWRRVRHADLRRREAALEEARRFQRWLDRLLALDGAVQGVISDDFARLQAATERAAATLRARATAVLDLNPTQMLLPIEGGTWRVPVWRSLRVLWPRETIAGERLVRALIQQVAAYHAQALERLIVELGHLLEEAERDLRAMRNVLRGAYDDDDDRESAYRERATRRIDEFVNDAEELRHQARAAIGRTISDVFNAFADLRSHTAMRVQRNLAVLGIRHMRRQLDDANSRWASLVDGVDRRWQHWLTETLKPALGLAHPARISIRTRRIDRAWTRPSEAPDDFAQIVLDRSNPRLLVTPVQLLKSVKDMRAGFDAGERGTLLLLTDNFGGAFGMLGQALSLYFRDVPYRLLRQQATKPLEALPPCDESVLFVDNLERMVRLDADGLAQTVELIDALSTHHAMVVMSVQQTAAEVLKLAAPSLSNVTLELNIAKFDNESFESVMRRRMATSGYRFELDDEGKFFSDLYAASSGIPGVGLRLLLRCARPLSDNVLELRYDLPPIDDFLNGLDLDERLLLRRLSMQPYFPVAQLKHAQATHLAGLAQAGMIRVHAERASIEPQFYGLLRDHLLRMNLV